MPNESPSSPPEPCRGFTFHAEVTAFEANLTQPAQRIVRGALSLPSEGGNDPERPADPTGLGTLVRYDSATSKVSGVRRSADEGPADAMVDETRAKFTMAGFEIEGGLLRVGALTADLTSEHGGDRHAFEELVNLDGLTNNGAPVKVNKSAMLGIVNGCATYTELKNRAATDNLYAPAGAPPNGKQIWKEGDDLVCFLFDPPRISFQTGTKQYEVELGKYRISDHKRQLSMLRVVARPRAPNTGTNEDTIVCGEVLLNGTGCP